MATIAMNQGIATGEVILALETFLNHPEVAGLVESVINGMLEGF